MNVDYQLLDSGKGSRLERVGKYTVVRPDPNVLWPMTQPQLPEWSNPDYRFVGQENASRWSRRSDSLPDQWIVEVDLAKIIVRPTFFRHLGIFPEQLAQWEWLHHAISPRKGKTPLRVLNLFAYTGVATIVATMAGAQVCHVDSAASSIQWAKENASASGLDELSIRWIVEDVRKFVAREMRRGSIYDLILLDPPVFGRGSKGEIWRLEDDLPLLLESVGKLLSEQPVGIWLNFYATTLYPDSVARLAEVLLPASIGKLDLNTLYLHEKYSERPLASGFSLHSS